MNYTVIRDPKPLPHMAESIDVQRPRYREAIAEVFDIEAMNLGTIMRPGELRRCVFDSADGLRLIVSREAEASLGRYLHVSASLDSDCPLHRMVMARGAGMTTFLVEAVGRYRAISGDTGPLDLAGITDKGVPHWFRAEEGR
jgi:hypothetical protein